jgi:hypothetical protein
MSNYRTLTTWNPLPDRKERRNEVREYEQFPRQKPIST